MYRRILLGTDFSAPATIGARLAANLAAPDAAILAVHVMPTINPQAFIAPAVGLDPVPGVGWGQAARGAPLSEEDETRARAQLDAWVEETGQRRLEGVVATGDVPGALLREAESHASDLIVLGARGHSRLEEVLVGSTSREVLRHAKCDVLLVEPTHAEVPRRIALATSFDDSSVVAARRAAQLAERHGAELLLLHAIGPGVQTGASYGLTPSSPPLEEASGWLEREVDRKLAEFNREHLGGRATPMRGRGHLAQEVIRLANEGRADLLVTGHHPSSWFERLLLGSVSEAVARHPPCSTLFVRA